MIEKIFIVLMAVFLLNVIIGGIIYHLTKGKCFKWLYHDLFEWHIPSEERGFDGCSDISTCRICGKSIMQDSQGNWF